MSFDKLWNSGKARKLIAVMVESHMEAANSSNYVGRVCTKSTLLNPPRNAHFTWENYQLTASLNARTSWTCSQISTKDVVSFLHMIRTPTAHSGFEARIQLSLLAIDSAKSDIIYENKTSGTDLLDLINTCWVPSIVLPHSNSLSLSTLNPWVLSGLCRSPFVVSLVVFFWFCVVVF